MVPLTESEFQNAAEIFLKNLFSQLLDKNIALDSHWDIDHLCYRVETENDYQKMKMDFSRFSDLLIESPVQGRLISTFQLKRQVVFNQRVIALVELPAPKTGKQVKTGFEHIEVVCSLSFEELRKRYANISTDDRGLLKEFNREFEINLDQASVKFHHMSLASVIRFEQNMRAFQALKKSELLRIFRDCDPLVAGTFPLGLEVSDSDIDLLLFSNDLSDLEERLKNSCSQFKNFSLQSLFIKKIPSLICRFEYEDLPFEVFAQPIPTAKQDAQRHLVVEERLLKLGGAALRARVQEQRRLGFKTEAAFINALGLVVSDPFERLLEMSSFSDLELNQILFPA